MSAEPGPDIPMHERSKEEILAHALRQMAARISVRTVHGWAHPDCCILTLAADLLVGAVPALASARGASDQRSSLKITCWRIFGSYFRSSIRSRVFVLFLRVT